MWTGCSLLVEVLAEACKSFCDTAMRCWRSNPVVVLLLVLLGPSDLARAHGGGLNSQGCHNNRKTGSYHCHRSSSSSPRSYKFPTAREESFPSGGSSSALISARVLSIGDGDTIRVSASGQSITVRLACIDAPEMAQSPYGLQARDQLRALLPKESSVVLSVQTRDRYGRSVAEIFTGSQNVNQALVSSGAAFVYWKYIAKCDRRLYASAESQARAKSLGIWSQPGGIIRPWVFRKSR